MGDKDIEVELIVNGAATALCNANIATGTTNVIDDETFKIGDLVIYSRKLHVKGGMES